VDDVSPCHRRLLELKYPSPFICLLGHWAAHQSYVYVLVSVSASTWSEKPHTWIRNTLLVRDSHSPLINHLHGNDLAGITPELFLQCFDITCQHGSLVSQPRLRSRHVRISGRASNSLVPVQARLGPLTLLFDQLLEGVKGPESISKRCLECAVDDWSI
jgi:hypothetical protein